MANFVVLQANYAKIIESTQARKIQAELRVLGQKPEGKWSRKLKKIGAIQKFGRIAKFSQLVNFAGCEILQSANFRNPLSPFDPIASC